MYFKSRPPATRGDFILADPGAPGGILRGEGCWATVQYGKEIRWSPGLWPRGPHPRQLFTTPDEACHEGLPVSFGSARLHVRPPAMPLRYKPCQDCARESDDDEPADPIGPIPDTDSDDSDADDAGGTSGAARRPPAAAAGREKAAAAAGPSGRSPNAASRPRGSKDKSPRRPRGMPDRRAATSHR